MVGGHGHVVPRPDGAKARCGGPAMCAVCASELSMPDASAYKNVAATPIAVRCATCGGSSYHAADCPEAE